MKAKPQGRLEGTLLSKLLKLRVAVIASNWVFQAMRYMNIYEVSLKLFLDIIFTLMFMSIFMDGMSFGVALTLSVVSAHTLNWVFNGHIFVLMRYVAPIPKTEKHFDDFIALMKKSALKWQSIDGIAIYGSYCRGELHKYSDLDVRVLTHPGKLNAIYGSIFCLYLRFIAFFHTFPLDIYCTISMDFLDQLRDDEDPFILIDHSQRLKMRYKSVEGV